jgi:transcriptional regulator with XRE-family HTH domain
LPSAARFVFFERRARSVGLGGQIHFNLSVATPRLSNYIRTHRRRAGLSQRELARLLGAESGTKVSRYETFTRMPSVMTIWACELVFNRPASEIFAGVYQGVLEAVSARAERMLTELASQRAPQQSTDTPKVQLLRSIVDLRRSAQSGQPEA